MQRRTLLITVIGLAAAPMLTTAQQPAAKVPRVGVIGERAENDPSLAAFRQALRDLGYTEGQNVIFDYRYTHGSSEYLSKYAAELVRQRVDVLVVGGTVAAQAAKAQTKTIPIVFAVASDPVRSGIAASLARPGGNATGMSTINAELSAKQLELLKTCVAAISRVAVLYNAENPGAANALKTLEVAAPALGLELRAWSVHKRSEVAAALASIGGWRANALLAVSDPLLGNELPLLVQFAAKNRLPALYGRREFAELGGLLAYGPSFPENYRRAAIYVDKILKGARADDLPVQQPTDFELVINGKTAKALGIAIPASMLLRADHVIE